VMHNKLKFCCFFQPSTFLCIVIKHRYILRGRKLSYIQLPSLVWQFRSEQHRYINTNTRNKSI
jgi:hypothetical protein